MVSTGERSVLPGVLQSVLGNPASRALLLLFGVAAAALLAACAPEEGAGTSWKPTTVLVVDDGTALWSADLEEEVAIRHDTVEGSTWLTASPAAVSDRVEGVSADVIVIQLPFPSAQASEEIVEGAVSNGLAVAVSTGAEVVVVSKGANGPYGEILQQAVQAHGAILVEVETDWTGVESSQVADTVRSLATS